MHLVVHSDGVRIRVEGGLIVSGFEEFTKEKKR